MDDTADPEGAEPFFSARLTPHRSLSPLGFLILMLATGAICFVCGMLFLTMGAWPVFGFFGLDVLLVYVAFRLSYAQARAYEEVHVSPSTVRVRKVDPRGRETEFRFNAYWARLDMTRIEDEGVVGLSLKSHGEGIPIGAFLNPGDRESFGHALAAALHTARGGRPSAETG